jgi:hypothetical protein
LSITLFRTPTAEAMPTEARQESTLEEDAARVVYLAHPLGARFPRRMPGG